MTDQSLAKCSRGRHGDGWASRLGEQAFSSENTGMEWFVERCLRSWGQGYERGLQSGLQSLGQGYKRGLQSGLKSVGYSVLISSAIVLFTAQLNAWLNQRHERQMEEQQREWERQDAAERTHNDGLR